MFDLDWHSAVRNASMVFCVVVLAVAFTAILYTHWSYRQQSQSHFHGSTLEEMGWSLAPVLMVLALVAVAFKDFWLV